jgi:molybdopterin biosynthesis enzyme
MIWHTWQLSAIAFSGGGTVPSFPASAFTMGDAFQLVSPTLRMWKEATNAMHNKHATVTARLRRRFFKRNPMRDIPRKNVPLRQRRQ